MSSATIHVATERAAALAEDLAAVLIDGTGDAGQVDRVDPALADALSALESLAGRGPAVDAVVTLATGLLADLRDGHVDRTTCRVASPLVVERLVRAVGEDAIEGVLRPVLVVLGALAVVPDAIGHLSSATDPDPDPSLPLEVALAACIADPSCRGRLLDVLASAVVHVPVLHAAVEGEHLGLRLVPLVLRDGAAACAFTSTGRLDEVVAEAGGRGVPTMAMTGAELVELWPAGHGLALNPGSVLGAVLSEREVRALPSRLAPRDV